MTSENPAPALAVLPAVHAFAICPGAPAQPRHEKIPHPHRPGLRRFRPPGLPGPHLLSRFDRDVRGQPHRAAADPDPRRARRRPPFPAVRQRHAARPGGGQPPRLERGAGVPPRPGLHPDAALLAVPRPHHHRGNHDRPAGVPLRDEDPLQQLSFQLRDRSYNVLSIVPNISFQLTID